MTGLLIQYLGSGDLASRPEIPSVVAGSLALYFARDSGVIFRWNPDTLPDGAWEALAVNPPSDEGLWVFNGLDGDWELDPIQEDAPSDGEEYVRKDGAWEIATAGSGLVDAPSDGTLYGRKDGAWEAVPGAGAVTESIIVAIGDETTAITTGVAKVTFRMPYAFTLSAVRASLTTASSSGTPTFDINEGGATILSTKITIDSGEKTSTTAATAPVISDVNLADDAEITIDVDVAGTGAAGAKIYLIGSQP